LGKFIWNKKIIILKSVLRNKKLCLKIDIFIIKLLKSKQTRFYLHLYIIEKYNYEIVHKIIKLFLGLLIKIIFLLNNTLLLHQNFIFFNY
jgi:hypothetical protein